MKTTSHILHLLLSVFTGGLWLPVWIFLAIRNRPKKEIKSNWPAAILIVAAMAPFIYWHLSRFVEVL